MQRGRDRIGASLVLTSSYLVVSSLLLAVRAQDPLALVLPLASFSVLILGPAWAYPPTILGSILYMPLTGVEGLASSLPVAMAYPLIVSRVAGAREQRGPPRPPLGSTCQLCLVYMLPFAPAVLLGIGPLMVYAILAVSVAIASSVASLRLEELEVIVPSELEALIGERVPLRIHVRAPRGGVKYWLIVGGEVSSQGSIEGQGEVIAYYRPLMLGLHRIPLEVIVEDPAGLAALRLGPYVVDVRVYSEASRIARVLGSIVGPLLEEAPRPRVVAIRIAPRPGAAGPGAGGLGPGMAGAFSRGRGIGASRMGRVGAGAAGATALGGLPGPGVAGGLEGMRPAPRGEYWGVRLYVPGDSLRDIHWKKSVSRGSLHVKEYRGGESGGSAGGRAALIVDLISSSPRELDRLALTVYAAILGFTGRGEVTLYLRLPEGSEYLVRGRTVEILGLWQDLLRSGALYTPYNYESPGEPVALDQVDPEAPGPAKALLASLEHWASHLIAALREAGLGRGAPVTVIHGRPTATLYAYLRRRFEAEKYRVLEPRPPKPGELARRARRILAEA